MKPAKTLIILSLFALSIVSCKKLIEKLFPSFDTSVNDIQVTIPTIPLSNVSGTLSSQTVHYNLDSLINAKTSGGFGIGDVTSIKVKSININFTNGDSASNMANFQYLSVNFSSNNNTIPLKLASSVVPDVNTNQLNLEVVNSPNIINYLKGTEITFSDSGTVRRSTKHPLISSTNVVLTVN